MAFSLIVPLKRAFPIVARTDRPLDGNRKIFGQPIFGKNRNYAGLTFAIIMAIAWWVATHNVVFSIEVILTFCGTLFGSFIKRRLKLPAGKMLPILDQVDYVFFVGLVFYVFEICELDVILTALVITIVGQPIVSMIAYILKLKDRPY